MNSSNQCLYQDMNHIWRIFVDGASRHNPGPSGIGIMIFKDETVAGSYGFFIGKKTNNQAEYYAFLMALFLVTSAYNERDSVIIHSDSLLLVNQITGHYKIKHADLIPLYCLAKKLCDRLSVTVKHVMRVHNSNADKLANDGIDKKTPLPSSFITFLKKHDITV